MELTIMGSVLVSHPITSESYQDDAKKQNTIRLDGHLIRCDRQALFNFFAWQKPPSPTGFTAGVGFDLLAHSIGIRAVLEI